MPITPITTNFNYKNHAPKKNFKANEEKTIEMTQEEYKELKNSLVGSGAFLGEFVWMALATITSSFEIDKNKELKQNIANKIENLNNSGEINTKTMKIKDINKDGSADFVFEKKDGTQIVYDLKNEILIEK